MQNNRSLVGGPPWVQLAIPLEILQRLIEADALCAAQVRCLDKDSKHLLQRLCMERCAKCLFDAPAFVAHRTSKRPLPTTSVKGGPASGLLSPPCCAHTRHQR